MTLTARVISEMVAASNRIGYSFRARQRGFHNRDLFAGVLTLDMLGDVLNRLFPLIEYRVLVWHHSYTDQRS